MEYLFSRSVSGRVFSRPECRDDEDDSFVCSLASLHRDACRVGLKGASVVINEGMSFDPKLLAFVKYAVGFYRDNCDCGWWDMGGFINSLDEIERRIEGDAEWYFSGALLFCVDRALACYQKKGPGNMLFVEWWRSARFLRFTLLKLDNSATENATGEKMKALNLLRHQSNHAARKKVESEWEKSPKKWPSAEKAGLFFADLLAKEGSVYEPRTVTGWIRAHAREIGVRFR